MDDLFAWEKGWICADEDVYSGCCADEQPFGC